MKRILKEEEYFQKRRASEAKLILEKEDKEREKERLKFISKIIFSGLFIALIIFAYFFQSSEIFTK